MSETSHLGKPALLSSVSRVYRGDVETIVAKALEKEKTRRYASAARAGGEHSALLDEPIVALVGAYFERHNC